MNEECSCCERSGASTEIDFHHWDYENDIGVYLCRECHLFIHDGKKARIQTRNAPTGESWRTDAVNNMVGLHEHYHGRADTWDSFFERYNIPKHDEYIGVYDLEL